MEGRAFRWHPTPSLTRAFCRQGPNGGLMALCVLWEADDVGNEVNGKIVQFCHSRHSSDVMGVSQ